MLTHIAGASVWEQEIYDHVSGHVVTEGAILDEYQRLRGPIRLAGLSLSGRSHPRR